jgi:hypothetical protein
MAQTPLPREQDLDYVTKLTLLIMAAGSGTRYGRLKQIDAVGPNGATIADYSVFDALQAGFEKVVFVIRRDIEEPFRATLGRRIEKQADVSYVFQGEDVPAVQAPLADRKKPWGTAHAVLSARDAVDEPFVVINADDFYGRDSYYVLGKHLQSQDSEAALIGFRLRNTLSEFGPVKRGLCVVDDDELQSVSEVEIERDSDGIRYADPAGGKHSLTGDEIVSMNMWGFQPAVFDVFHQSWIKFARDCGQSDVAELYIPSVVTDLISGDGGSCRVLETPSRWFGVTYAADRAVVSERITELISQGAYPDNLWSS